MVKGPHSLCSMARYFCILSSFFVIATSSESLNLQVRNKNPPAKSFRNYFKRDWYPLLEPSTVLYLLFEVRVWWSDACRDLRAWYHGARRVIGILWLAASLSSSGFILPTEIIIFKKYRVQPVLYGHERKFLILSRRNCFGASAILSCGNAYLCISRLGDITEGPPYTKKKVDFLSPNFLLDFEKPPPYTKKSTFFFV